MNKMQRQVLEFHTAYNVHVGASPGFPSDERCFLRKELCREEVKEVVDAIDAKDLTLTADAIADAVYVLLGTAVEFGIDLAPIFDEVHKSNMSKLGADGKPILSETGKVLKGPNFKLPDLRPLLEAQQGGLVIGYANKLPLLKQSPVRVEHKAWGREEWLVNSENYCMKLLLLNQGRASSKHYHKIKEETFIIGEGGCYLEISGLVVSMTLGDMITIKPGVAHRFFSTPTLSGGPCRIIEVSTQHFEDDIVRLTQSGAFQTDMFKDQQVVA